MRKITKKERLENICESCMIAYETNKVAEYFVIHNNDYELTARNQLREFFETFAIQHAPIKYDCHRNGNNEYCIKKLEALKLFTKYEEK